MSSTTPGTPSKAQKLKSSGLAWKSTGVMRPKSRIKGKGRGSRRANQRRSASYGRKPNRRHRNRIGMRRAERYIKIFPHKPKNAHAYPIEPPRRRPQKFISRNILVIPRTIFCGEMGENCGEGVAGDKNMGQKQKRRRGQPDKQTPSGVRRKQPPCGDTQ